MEHFDKAEVQEIRLNDTTYPHLLRGIDNPPFSLRVRGSQPLQRKIVAISGSRKTTPEALQTADKIGKMLTEHGWTVVTGLAKGCDAAAVQGTLSEGGNVIGVVPHGLKALPTHTQFSTRNLCYGWCCHFRIPGQFLKSLCKTLSPAQ